jgi:hypothetical protein
MGAAWHGMNPADQASPVTGAQMCVGSAAAQVQEYRWP